MDEGKIRTPRGDGRGNWDVLSLGGEAGRLAGRVFDCFGLSELVDVAVLSPDGAIDVAGFNAEASVGSFESVRETSIFVHLTNLFQDQHRWSGDDFFFLGLRLQLLRAPLWSTRYQLGAQQR